MEKQKVSISWSGGKDASFALFKILKSEKYQVVSLHTTIDAVTKKVGLHGINERLIEKQAELLNMSLDKIYLNIPGTTISYEDAMHDYYTGIRRQGINKIISGDIFLEDLRIYKEEIASKAGINLEFPLWGSSTRELVEEFIDAGFKSIICAADTRYFKLKDLGQTIDKDFINNLSEKVDPCGENGEYHSFTFDGPHFKEPLKVKVKRKYTEKHSFATSSENTIHSEFAYLDLVLDE